MTKIIIRSGTDMDRSVVIPEKGVTFGRNLNCDVTIVEPSVSSQHGSIRFEHGAWWIHDNDSSNGTFVNDKKVHDFMIQNGDKLKFGSIEVEFYSAPETPPSLLSEEPVPSGSDPAAAGLADPPSGWRTSVASTDPESEPNVSSEALTLEPVRSPSDAGVDQDVASEEITTEDSVLIMELAERYQQIRTELADVIIGQSAVLEEVMIALFSRGHVLLVGMPGLAKRLFIQTLSQMLDLGYQRVPFTPDLAPSDITGMDVSAEDTVTGWREHPFDKGPIFTNILFADGINRTPPKVQAALLGAMQDYHITVGSRTHLLPEPFFVVATQNPIGQEGTYPLPEAQLDQFVLSIAVDYPSAEEESRIVARMTCAKKSTPRCILDGAFVLRVQDMLQRLPVASDVIDFACNLVRSTRPGQPEAPGFVKEMVEWGAGPRASVCFIQSAKARAVLDGRNCVTKADVTAVAMPVLRHRVILTAETEATGITGDDVIRMLLEALALSEDGG